MKMKNHCTKIFITHGENVCYKEKFTNLVAVDGNRENL